MPSLPSFVKVFLWLLGFDPWSEKGPSGFGGEDLVAERTPTGFERGLRIACTAILITTCLTYAIAELASLIGDGSYWIAAPSLVWAGYMLFHRSIPMDRQAIGLGFMTFSPYYAWAMFFAIGVHLNLSFDPLLWQLVTVGGAIAYGLFRDISKEMDKSA